MGEKGSVGFMFERVGIVEYNADVASEEEMFEAAVEAGADNAQSDGDGHNITCSVENLNDVRDAMIEKYGDPEAARIGWVAKDSNDIESLQQATTLLKLIDALEESDDVQYVTGNFNIPDEIADQLG